MRESVWREMLHTAIREAEISCESKIGALEHKLAMQRDAEFKRLDVLVENTVSRRVNRILERKAEAEEGWNVPRPELAMDTQKTLDIMIEKCKPGASSPTSDDELIKELEACKWIAGSFHNSTQEDKVIDRAISRIREQESKICSQMRDLKWTSDKLRDSNRGLLERDTEIERLKAVCKQVLDKIDCLHFHGSPVCGACQNNHSEALELLRSV
jgi:hypothetical protein